VDLPYLTSQVVQSFSIASVLILDKNIEKKKKDPKFLLKFPPSMGRSCVCVCVCVYLFFKLRIGFYLRDSDSLIWLFGAGNSFSKCNVIRGY